MLSRGDRREAIFLDDGDREEFLRALGQACAKTGWDVHAYCLMSNHFHFVVETPAANLVVGMQWLLGTYTQRFNRRHRLSGHLFQGRYKAQAVDERSGEYLRAACDYVHLNPVRAELVGAEEKLETFAWSSYPAYRQLRLRPEWLRVDRLLGEHGLQEDTAATRRELEGRMDSARRRPDEELVQGVRRGVEGGSGGFCRLAGGEVVAARPTERTGAGAPRNGRRARRADD